MGVELASLFVVTCRYRLFDALESHFVLYVAVVRVGDALNELEFLREKSWKN